MTKFTAQDFRRLYVPKKCDLRVHLHEKGVPEAEPSEFEQVLLRLGQRYEADHLATLQGVFNLQFVEQDQRFEKTVQLVKEKCPVLYQPLLKVQTTLDGLDCEVVGEPDFLIRENDGYVIRDVKMARRVDEKNHPEIVLQLQLYGWLYEQVFGLPPVKLEVLNGKGELVPIAYDSGGRLLPQAIEILLLRRSTQEPYSPVGWTKCTGCGFHEYCWPKAEAAKDVALINGVDQGLAVELHRQGVETISRLIDRFDERSLSEFKRPWGQRTQKVGKGAGDILRRARVMLSRKEILLHPPEIPESACYVMFDLEGMPPHLDELDKIYLWGTKVFGKVEGKFLPAVAGFGEHGDREGWNQFLANAEAIFTEFGDIPFVHWHHYEKTHIDKYVQRYGDPKGVAARVLKNLLDLLPVARDCILLPLTSYSLKVVEKYAGFERSQKEYGGSWSIAKYIEATETQDKKLRDELIGQILLYNEEDLAATWKVLQWLKKKTVGAA